MGISEEIAKFVADMERAGIAMDHASMPAGVFFTSEQSARLFADKFGKEVVQVNGGWVAMNRPQPN
jgi:hypothetical protein